MTIASFLKFRRSHADTAGVEAQTVAQPASDGAGHDVRTFLGWTPGLRSLVSGRALTCGCLVGVYETRAGSILEVVDARGPACPHAGHHRNAILHGESGSEG